MGYYQGRGQRTLGRDALTEFLYSNAPVRWWHVSHAVTRDGDVTRETTDAAAEGRANQMLNADASQMGGSNANSFKPAVAGAPVVMISGGASRIRAATHDDFGAVFVIVDADQLGNVGFEALSDYLAMVTLSQLDPDADTTAWPTVLKLFNGQANRPQAMTDWDVSYLQGLYEATRDARNVNQQRSEIAQHMDHTLQPPPSPQ